MLLFEEKLYLFDTFEGFRVEEAKKEIEKGNCSQAFVDIFKDTSVDVVLNKMMYKENVIIKKGYFPESLDGLEEEFVFVSIDVDLEDSIYNSLVYFYLRLVKGGYLFIHEYNLDPIPFSLLVNASDGGMLFNLQGVRKAVQRYEKDYNIQLCKVPLVDDNGTLVVTK